MIEQFYKIDQDGILEIYINKKLFSKKSLATTAYIFLEKAYIMFDNDTSNRDRIIVLIKPKDQNIDLSKLAWEFYSKLIEEEVLLRTRKETEKIREDIINAATQNYIENEEISEEERAEEMTKEIKEEVDKPMYTFRANEKPAVEDLFVNDPLGIAKRWEEKYGKNDSK